MSDGLAFVTVITRNYGCWARTWADSVREQHPDAEVYVGIADEPTAQLNELLANYHTIVVPEHAAAFGIDEWNRFSFQYTPFELTCSLKPFLVKHLQKQHEKVIYLDADTLLFRPLTDVVDRMNDFEVLMTPHLVQPGRTDVESSIRAAGTINGGFLACRAGLTSTHFLNWWSEKCQHECCIDPYAGKFVDQTWLDLAINFGDSIGVMRDPSLNVAYWNLNHRDLKATDSGFTVDEEPIGFFHFSGFDPKRPETLSRFDTRQPSSSLAALLQLMADRLNQHQESLGQLVDCAYSHYSDGTEIDPIHREAFRLAYSEFRSVRDPFDVASNPKMKKQLIALRGRLVQSRKHWQLEELQKIVDRQSAWIAKKVRQNPWRRWSRKMKDLWNRATGKGEKPTAEAPVTETDDSNPALSHPKPSKRAA